MSAHATLGPSSADRWMSCTASVALIATLPPDEGSTYAREGNVAHDVAEIELLAALGQITQRTRKNRLTRLGNTADGKTYLNHEMRAIVQQYVDMIMEEIEELGGVDVAMVEARVSLARWVPGSFGTSDCILIKGSTMHVLDYKHGQGVPVDAVRNPQMSLYALGALDLFGAVYDVDTVRMTIVQPRANNISSYEVPAADLLTWADEVVRPAALAATTGEGTVFAPSEKACRFCPAKAVCRARAEKSLLEDFGDPRVLDLDEVADLLGRLPSIKSWCDDVAKYALDVAKAGGTIPGYKLVEGRSSRKITNVGDALDRLTDAGVAPEQVHKAPELKSLTELTRIVGKDLYEILGDAVTKPAGSPTLVPEDDKRPALGSAAAAAADFAGED